MRYNIYTKEEMIETIAKVIVDNGIEDVAELVIEGLLPAGYFLGRIGYLTAFPMIYVLFGEKGEDYSHLLGFEFQETMPLVVNRMRELRKEKEKERYMLAGLEKMRGPISLKMKIKEGISYLFPTTFVHWLLKKLRGSSD